jgi:hypothetical protein
MLPPGGLPYEDIPKRTSGSQELMLPELPGKSQQLSNYQNQGSISYQALSQINRGYPYKSPMD